MGETKGSGFALAFVRGAATDAAARALRGAVTVLSQSDHTIKRYFPSGKSAKATK